MQQLIYTSRATSVFGASELAMLLANARANNLRRGLTGCLLHVDGHFLQVVEGDAEQVNTVFAKIAKDVRHDSVITLLRRDTDPQFKDWSMGFADASGQAALIDGYRPTNGFADLEGDPTRLLQVINGFRAGRWRNAA